MCTAKLAEQLEHSCTITPTSFHFRSEHALRLAFSHSLRSLPLASLSLSCGWLSERLFARTELQHNSYSPRSETLRVDKPRFLLVALHSDNHSSTNEECKSCADSPTAHEHDMERDTDEPVIVSSALRTEGHARDIAILETLPLATQVQEPLNKLQLFHVELGQKMAWKQAC